MVDYVYTSSSLTPAIRVYMAKKIKSEKRVTTGFRFDALFLEKLRAASGATGLTVTEIVEKCVEKSINDVLIDAQKERDASTAELQTLLKLRK